MAKFDLEFSSPVMNTAGMLGFAPDLHGTLDLNQLGAFVTNPISLAPRTPAQGTRSLPFPGGMLLHTGFPNPGLRTVLRQFSHRWERSPLPVIVHLLAHSPAEIATMAERLEGMEGVWGLELGLPPDASQADLKAFINAAQGEIPLIVCLPFERAREFIPTLLAFDRDNGLLAVSLSPPRGKLPGPDGHLVSGRLYGPSLYPQALAVVRDLVVALQGRLAVVGSGGIYHPQQKETMLASGASMVQLDTILWRGGLDEVSAPSKS